jgi:fructokinase
MADNLKNKKLLRPLIFGEVLFDCFPDGSRVLGGAPFNVAWNLRAFGMQPVFISRVGRDELGDSIRSAMQQWGMTTSGLQLDAHHPTGIVDVTLKGSEPKFDIVAERAYDFIDASILPSCEDAPLLYHGSLASRNPVSREALNTLKQHHRIPAFVDVNLRTPWWDVDTVLALLQDANWVKLNEDELAALVHDWPDVESRARQLQQRYELHTVFVTQGSAGAMALESNGEITSVTPASNLAVVDSVGAGDAFASVLLLGLLLGWPIDRILSRAQEFASAVVGIRGATRQDIVFYQSFIDRWELS